MSQNPYEATTATNDTPRTRPTRWMIVAGCIALGFAAVCLLATVVMMMLSFDAVANSTTTPKPSDLVTGISTAMIPSVAVVPPGLVGIAFLVLGFVRRQPVPGT